LPFSTLLRRQKRPKRTPADELIVSPASASRW
jgi:hypothetical protein